MIIEYLQKAPFADFYLNLARAAKKTGIFRFILITSFIKGRFPSYPDGTLFTFIQHLTLTQNIGLNPSGLTYNLPSWSISVELWVNIIFILFISKATKSSTLFILALTGLLVIYGNTGHLDIHSSNYYGFLNSGMLRGMSSFFLGILSYRIYLFYREDVRVFKYINYINATCVMAVIVVVFGRAGRLSGIDIFAPFVFMFAVSVFALESGMLSKHLMKLKYLGGISYSIYLNQISVLMICRFTLGRSEMSSFLMLTIYLLILVGYSHYTYKYIENPLRKRGRNVLSRIIE